MQGIFQRLKRAAPATVLFSKRLDNAPPLLYNETMLGSYAQPNIVQAISSASSGLSAMEMTPDNFTQFHIFWVAIMTFTVLCNAVVMILAPSRIEHGKAKVARAVLFALNCIIVLVGILFMTMKMLMSAGFTGFKINENFTVVSGNDEYALPVISAVFAALDLYSLFGAIGSAALCFAFAGIVVQIILWTVGKRRKTDVGTKVGKTDAVLKPEPQKPAGPEPLKEQPDTSGTTQENNPEPSACNGDETEKTARTRRLGNKVILKSDAASVYLKYIADKKTR